MTTKTRVILALSGLVMITVAVLAGIDRQGLLPLTIPLVGLVGLALVITSTFPDSEVSNKEDSCNCT